MRIPDFTPADLSPRQREVYDEIAAGPRGSVQGPVRIWLQNPDLAEVAQEYGAFCRFRRTLSDRLYEIAVLFMGARWRAGFEWHVHAPAAMEAGVEPAVVETIRRGERPDFAKEDEAAVYDLCRELLDGRVLSDATYRRALDAAGQQGVVELVGILGYYALISMTIVAFEVAPPGGAPDPFADLPPRGS
jgi:4-carboxymuconolactone decarboxylase